MNSWKIWKCTFEKYFFLLCKSICQFKAVRSPSSKSTLFLKDILCRKSIYSNPVSYLNSHQWLDIPRGLITSKTDFSNLLGLGLRQDWGNWIKSWRTVLPLIRLCVKAHYCEPNGLNVEPARFQFVYNLLSKILDPIRLHCSGDRISSLTFKCCIIYRY